MAIDSTLLTDNFEVKKELLKGYYADYKQLLEDEQELKGKLEFSTFLKFSCEFDRQQRLTIRRQENAAR